MTKYRIAWEGEYRLCSSNVSIQGVVEASCAHRFRVLVLDAMESMDRKYVIEVQTADRLGEAFWLQVRQNRVKREVLGEALRQLTAPKMK